MFYAKIYYRNKELCTRRNVMLFGTHAKVFIAVVEQGNIQEAASVLKISQSSVSYHLKELEKEVGFQLYDRSQKPNHLTEEGALLFRELRQEREHLARTLGKLRSGSSIRPTLRFGIVESLARNLGASVIENLASRLSSIVMVTGTSERLYSKLKHRDIDWAITSRLPDASKFLTQKLFSEPSVLAVPLSMDFGAKAVSWQDLKFCGLPLLRYIRSSGGHKITESLLGALSVDLPVKIEVDDGGVMLKLIAEGFGWSFIRPATLIQHLELTERIRILPMPNPVMQRQLILAYRKDIDPQMRDEILVICDRFYKETLHPEIIRLAPWLAASLPAS